MPETRRSKAAPRRRRAPTTVEEAFAAPRARLELREPPHAHIVCRGCGRIVRLELGPEEGQQLTALADRSPDGWVVGAIAFSLTGACADCQRTGRA